MIDLLFIFFPWIFLFLIVSYVYVCLHLIFLWGRNSLFMGWSHPSLAYFAAHKSWSIFFSNFLMFFFLFFFYKFCSMLSPKIKWPDIIRFISADVVINFFLEKINFILLLFYDTVGRTYHWSNTIKPNHETIEFCIMNKLDYMSEYHID